MTNLQTLLNFAKDLSNNYDCECYRNDQTCRACKATEVIREVMGDKADSLLDGPYYGSSPEIVDYLSSVGKPTDHLTTE
jgi:hypothetical protein